MTPEESERVEELFAAAADLPPTQRIAFLEEARRAGPLVLAEVEALLAAEAQLGPIDHPATPDGEEMPATVGPYRVVRKIGEGGMSEVYLGVRNDGVYERRVAIKRIRAELRTREMIRRFEVERRILASLDHPAIARLLDAGETPDGTPYLIMEYVEGEPIDLYCDRHRLTLAERVEIFRQVCLGVHCAHQNLIVHRDLKPSNILVAANGQPKLLDFGVAKLLNPGLLPQGGEPTAAWLRVLTPEYASPEQLLGTPITTASDLYSLGVLLFKLLTGVDPYGRWEGRARTIETLALAVEPEAPSRCVRRLGRHHEGTSAADRGGALEAGELARLRSIAPREWERQLEGRLDAITLQALRKEPQKRQASAAQLADELAGKSATRGAFFRPARRRGRSLLAGGVAVACAVALLALGLRLRGEAEARRIEGARAARTAATLRTLLSSVPERGWARQASESLRLGLAGSPTERAELFAALGQACRSRGWASEAASAFEQSLSAHRETGTHQSLEAAQVHIALGDVDTRLLELREAQKSFRAALSIQRRLAPADAVGLSVSLSGLARALLAAKHPADAEPLFQQSLALRRETLGERHALVAEALEDLGRASEELANASSAAFLYLLAARIRQVSAGPDSREVALALVQQSAALVATGIGDGALPEVREAERISRLLCPRGARSLTTALESLTAAPECGLPPLPYPQQAFLERSVATLVETFAGREGRLEAVEAAWNLGPPPPTLSLEPDQAPRQGSCVPDGGFAAVGRQPCCSGVAAGGSAGCTETEDWGATWTSCRHVCGSRTVDGCVPAGGVTDALRLTDCCSGASVPQSLRCLNPADATSGFRTCVLTCA